MTGGDPRARNVKAGEHLRLLRSLAGELERAMLAISSNNLQELEESVANQQDLSARLEHLATGLSDSPVAPNVFPSDSIAPDLMVEIRAAAAELQFLNLRYALLLQHSSRSVALMASLFNSFTGQLKEASGARVKLQTWSCQM